MDVVFTPAHSMVTYLTVIINLLISTGRVLAQRDSLGASVLQCHSPIWAKFHDITSRNNRLTGAKICVITSMISLVTSTVLLHGEISLTVVSFGELLMEALMFHRCGFETRNCAIFLEVSLAILMASYAQENHTMSPIAREIGKETCLTLWSSLCRLMSPLGIYRQIDNRVRVLCTSQNRLTLISAKKDINSFYRIFFLSYRHWGHMFQMLLHLWTG